MVGGGSVSVVGFGGNGWDVPVLVACILACFIIAVSTLALLVLYIWYPSGGGVGRHCTCWSLRQNNGVVS